MLQNFFFWGGGGNSGNLDLPQIRFRKLLKLEITLVKSVRRKKFYYLKLNISGNKLAPRYEQQPPIKVFCAGW